jgi:Trypsin-like peptidase domain
MHDDGAVPQKPRTETIEAPFVDLDDIVEFFDRTVSSVDALPVNLREVDPRAAQFRKLSRQVCLIRREFAPESTGFLVGPDLMLTAAHNLMGTEGIFADPAEVTILFDQFMWDKRTGRVAKGEQCGLRAIPRSRPRQPDIVASSIRTDPNCEQVISDNELDYVLVRLDRPIGLSFLPYSHRIRGWNNVRIAEIAPLGSVFVIQHPLGGLQKFAEGRIREIERRDNRGKPVREAMPDGDFPQFFQYETRSLSGTSGSPIFDARREVVVGLHIGERLDENNAAQPPAPPPGGSDEKPAQPPAHQLGVSFQQIFEDLQEQQVKLPGFDLVRPDILNSIFGSSAVARQRKPGNYEWGGDRVLG